MVGYDTANLEQELTVDLNPTTSDFMARIGTDLQQGYIYKEPHPPLTSCMTPSARVSQTLRHAYLSHVIAAAT